MNFKELCFYFPYPCF